MKTLKSIFVIILFAVSVGFISCKKECNAPHKHKGHHDCNHHNNSGTSDASTSTAST